LGSRSAPTTSAKYTHTFALDDLSTAIRYARDRVDDAIKVVVKAHGVTAQRAAAEGGIRRTV
jgi:hypothetical protein